MNCWASKSVLAAGLALLGVAHAGHEFPFYPSFYPQEITVEALDAQTAERRLANGTLHAYAGTIETNPAKTAAVASLGDYVVAKVDRDGCAAARGLKQALPAGAVWHPYPVTPFHADYLHHADRAEAARAKTEKKQTEIQIEVVEAGALMAKASTRYNGWSGPPWLRQGWFHAYLLLAPTVPDARIENAARRLMRGDYRSFEGRLDLERSLVALLQSGCERVVLGYTVRREHYAVEYSAGVENVGYDALEGLASPIFPRTVKLRDFPWNGWLNVAAPAAPSSAWNPLAGGFGDAFSRLVWSALSDPAFLSAPHGSSWIDNRAHAKAQKSKAPLAVPEDALFSRGRDTKAATRVVYNVHNSAFHDGTPMTVADLLYVYAFAAAWSSDPGIAQATALARERVKGVRVLRVETETLAFGEDKLSYEVPVIEVYLDGGSRGDAATVAPPWTTLPWHLLALFEEGARRGHFKLSEVDPVRNVAIVQRLGELARELEERAYVPPALISHVKTEEARARYRRLREFHAAHGHWLVTNGPYLLDRWDGTKAVLSVFRDLSYPKGLGSFNAYAVPLKAHVTRVERRGYGAEVQIETERLEREGREVRIVRGSPEKKQAPVCHYLLVRRDGGIAAAGAVRAGAEGTCRLQLRTPGYQLMVAAVLEDSAANAPIRIVPWE